MYTSSWSFRPLPMADGSLPSRRGAMGGPFFISRPCLSLVLTPPGHPPSSQLKEGHFFIIAYRFA